MAENRYVANFHHPILTASVTKNKQALKMVKKEVRLFNK